jgi:UDP-glucose 4-epimerase
MIRRAGKLSMPLPSGLFATGTELGRRAGLMSFSPDFRRLLRYGRAVDTTRLVEEVGYRPRFDAAGAVEDYVRTKNARRMAPTVREAVT